MNNLAEYIKDRRLNKGWSKRKLALEAGISHTEVHRIENGERKNPSVNILDSLAKALGLPKEEVLRMAGYIEENDIPLIEKVFPDIKSKKQQETVQRIVDGLARSTELQDQDYDDLINQMEMFLDYAKKKKNTP